VAAPPEQIDPTGVPGERSGREGLLLAAALLVGVLALVFTLGWVVFHQIVGDESPPPEQAPTQAPLTGGEGGSVDG
jgi:hypothetical protein